MKQLKVNNTAKIIVAVVYNKFVWLMRNKNQTKVELAEIYYIRGDNELTYFYLILANGTLEVVCDNNGLCHWIKELDPALFWNPHQSYLVNIDYIDKYSSEHFFSNKYGTVKGAGGNFILKKLSDTEITRVPISRGHYPAIKKKMGN